MIINPDSIHLWYAYDEQITDPQLLSRYHRLLNAEERAQQKRFHFKKHRHQYLITRALVRTVLSIYVSEIAPDQWEFTKNKFGKPAITKSRLGFPLRFNISHTDKLVVLAVTLDREVGVDVEYLLRPGKTVEIAERYFSAVEYQQLLALPTENQKDRFFDLWVLKEAYIKACGMGLSIPLDQFSYSFSRQGEISIFFEAERNDEAEHWQFWQICPGDIHKVAVAIKNENKKRPYILSMRKIIPLAKFVELNYPVGMQSSNSSPASIAL